MTDTSMQISGDAEETALALPPALGDYIALLKPRVVSLVVYTGFVGLLLAPGSLHPVLAVVAVLCIAVAAGAAGAINMWYERDLDGRMARTRARPLPAGRMEPGQALGFGVVLATGAVAVMGLGLNWPAAALLALSVVFYIFVYTIWLKRRTPQNIVIGGAAGAFPPMIGWVAVTGEVSLAALALFAIIFIWTPPHFWALALYRSGDYARAGIPMLPVVAGARETRRQILLYALALVPVSLAPWYLGAAGTFYAAAAGALGAGFVVCAVRVWLENGAHRAARRMFGFSILYLFLLFTALLMDKALVVGEVLT